MKFSQVPFLVAAVTVCLTMSAQPRGPARAQVTIRNYTNIDWTVRPLRWCYNTEQNPVVTLNDSTQPFLLLAKTPSKSIDVVIHYGGDRKGVFGFELYDKAANKAMWVTWFGAVEGSGDWQVVVPLRDGNSWKLKDIEWLEGGDYNKTLILKEAIGDSFFR